jgi:hypothetical protein
MKVGSFTRETGAKPESIHRKDKLSLRARADGDERDGHAFFWRVRALVEARRALVRSTLIGVGYRCE